MKAYVYSDGSLERYAGRFVWLSINTEEAKNAKFLERYPIPALPTILVLDPQRDNVALRYVGGVTVSQLRKLLDDAEETYLARSTSRADSLLKKGDGLAAEGKHADAARTYIDAVAAAPRGWPKLGRTGEALVIALAAAGHHERCASRALELYPKVKGTSSAGVIAATGVNCAIALEKTHKKRVTMMYALEKATQEVLDDEKIVISDDDRSSLYLALIEARDQAGDDEEVVRLKHQWTTFLEGAAARATTAEQRAVYDSHRLYAYLQMGTPEKAVPMLEQSERDFPDDYNPPARLAWAYKALHQFDKALAASDRALAKVYGPRKIAVLNVRADIYVAMQDTAKAKETIRQAIEVARSLPEAQRSAANISSLEKRLASIR